MTQTWKAMAVACLLVLCCLPAYAQSEAAAAAQKAAEAWLALVDDGKYGESWEESAAVFRSQVSKQQWQAALRKVREPLGKTQSRKLKGAKHTTELPNAPKGEYVVIQYETSFENVSGVETITPMKEEDGSWRVSGYFIKPQ